MIARRQLLMGAGAAGLALGWAASRAATPIPSGERDPLMPLWAAWKSMHLAPTGRILDRFQGGVSHSEGQGYALVIAEAVGDREAFELIAKWTMDHLARREADALLAWRWAPADGGTITDFNNASDGDLFFAWGLCRGARRWQKPEWLEVARAISADLVRLCIVPCPRGENCTLMLPGEVGFQTDTGIIINPAYYMIRAMRELALETGEMGLERAAADGSAIISQLARDRLPPDWVEVTASGFAPAEGKSPDFGYEALRVPMYLFWSNLAGHAAVQQAARAYGTYLTAGSEDIPTVIDVSSGVAREASPDPGYRALAALATCAGGGSTTQVMPAFSAEQAYYPATLHLLSLLAQRESQFGCYVR